MLSLAKSLLVLALYYFCTPVEASGYVCNIKFNAAMESLRYPWATIFIQCLQPIIIVSFFHIVIALSTGLIS